MYLEMQVSKVKILEAEKKRLAFDEVSRAQIVRAVASPKVILLLSLCAPVCLAGAPSPPLLPPLQIPSFSLPSRPPDERIRHVFEGGVSFVFYWRMGVQA